MDEFFQGAGLYRVHTKKSCKKLLQLLVEHTGVEPPQFRGFITS